MRKIKKRDLPARAIRAVQHPPPRSSGAVSPPGTSLPLARVFPSPIEGAAPSSLERHRTPIARPAPHCRLAAAAPPCRLPQLCRAVVAAAAAVLCAAAAVPPMPCRSCAAAVPQLCRPAALPPLYRCAAVVPPGPAALPHVPQSRCLRALSSPDRPTMTSRTYPHSSSSTRVRGAARLSAPRRIQVVPLQWCVDLGHPSPSCCHPLVQRQ
jgi:hypothetical protein